MYQVKWKRKEHLKTSSFRRKSYRPYRQHVKLYLQIQNGRSSVFLRGFLPSSLFLLATFIPSIHCIPVFSGDWFHLNGDYCACSKLARDRRTIIAEPCVCFQEPLLASSSKWSAHTQLHAVRPTRHLALKLNPSLLPVYNRKHSKAVYRLVSYVSMRDLIKIRSKYHLGMPTTS